MTDLSAFYEHLHRVDLDPHPQYSKDTDLAAHVAAPDPHTGYRLESAQIQTADIADAAVTRAKLASEAHTAWTPSFTQSNTGLTGTNNWTRYERRGRNIKATIHRTFSTGTLGVAGNTIFVTNASLPADPAFTAAEILGVGGGYFFLAGVQYAVQCVLVGTGSANGTQLRFLRSDVAIANYLGIDPNAAISNGDKVGVSFEYEAVS